MSSTRIAWKYAGSIELTPPLLLSKKIFNLGRKHERLTDISASRAGEKVWIRARVQTSRPTGKQGNHSKDRKWTDLEAIGDPDPQW